MPKTKKKKKVLDALTEIVHWTKTGCYIKRKKAFRGKKHSEEKRKNSIKRWTIRLVKSFKVEKKTKVENRRKHKRIRSLAQEWLVCQLKDFYKGRRKKPRRDKNQRIIHKIFASSRTYSNRLNGLLCAQHKGWNQTHTKIHLYEIFQHWCQKDDSASFQIGNEEITRAGTRINMASHSSQ